MSSKTNRCIESGHHRNNLYGGIGNYGWTYGSRDLFSHDSVAGETLSRIGPLAVVEAGPRSSIVPTRPKAEATARSG